VEFFFGGVVLSDFAMFLFSVAEQQMILELEISGKMRSIVISHFNFTATEEMFDKVEYAFAVSVLREAPL
jgi:hypothetical protein